MGLLAVQSEYLEAIPYSEKIRANLFTVYLPFYRYLSEVDGGFHMSWEYSRYYHFVMVELFDFWRSATGEDLFRSNPWLVKSQRFQLYGLNDQLQFAKHGDIHHSEVDHNSRLFALKIAQEYQDGIAQAEADWLFSQTVKCISFMMSYGVSKALRIVRLMHYQAQLISSVLDWLAFVRAGIFLSLL